MGGQSVWNDAGTGVNDKVVKEEIIRSLYYRATYGCVFGKLNDRRDVKVIEIDHKGGKIKVDAGNDSPVFEKQLNENNTAIFTMREENKGMATYGDADVKPGDFAEYKHTTVEARTVDTPAYPIVGFESEDNIKRVVSDLVSVEKANIAAWIAKEWDLDAFRALFMGASRGLLDTENGGKGVTLTGATRGQWRAPLNTFVAGASGLTAQHWDATAHNAALATALGALTPVAGNAFSFEQHEVASLMLGKLGIQPVRISGRQYRAVALIDERNLISLRRDPKLIEIWTHATPRAEDNLALYSRDTLILNDILYLPVQQLSFFRPKVDVNNQITWGCGMDQDPRSRRFTNNSNITSTIYLGAGALRRGRRKDDIRFTVEQGRHNKAQEYAAHYDDGWKRNEWYTADGRQEMLCDSSLFMFNCDNGPNNVNI